jgi:hypothetical protein
MNKHKDTMHYYLQFDENGKQTTYLTEKNRLEGFVYYKAPQDFNPLKDLCFLKDGIVVLNKGSLIKKTQEEREQRIVDKQIAMLKMFSDSNEFRTISLDHNNIEILIVNNGDFRSILLEQKNLLEDKIKVGLITEDEAYFNYLFNNSIIKLHYHDLIRYSVLLTTLATELFKKKEALILQIKAKTITVEQAKEKLLALKKELLS